MFSVFQCECTGLLFELVLKVNKSGPCFLTSMKNLCNQHSGIQFREFKKKKSGLHRAVFLCTTRLDGVDPLCCLCHSIHMSALFIGRGLMLDTTLKWSRETSGRQCSWGVRTPPDILAPTPKIYIHVDLVVARI